MNLHELEDLIPDEGQATRTFIANHETMGEGWLSIVPYDCPDDWSIGDGSGEPDGYAVFGTLKEDVFLGDIVHGGCCCGRSPKFILWSDELNVSEQLKPLSVIREVEI
jgi:hypothetical protein